MKLFNRNYDVQDQRNYFALYDHLNQAMEVFTLFSSYHVLEACHLPFQYHCCGTNNYTEWEDSAYGKNVTGVPDSCCKIVTEGCGHNVFNVNKTESIFTDGCYPALNNSAMRNIGAIIGGAVALALLQVCALISIVPFMQR